MSIYKIGLFFKEDVKTKNKFPETRPVLKITEAYIYRTGDGLTEERTQKGKAI